MVMGDMINRGVAEGTVRQVPPDLLLSFRMGITLFPLFMRSDIGRREMVTDDAVIERITRESLILLRQFLEPIGHPNEFTQT